MKQGKLTPPRLFARTKPSTMRIILTLTAVSLLLITVAPAQNSSKSPQPDTSVIDPDGTAHITRVIPVPTSLSPQAQASLKRQMSDAVTSETLAERRTKTDTWQNGAGEASRALYPINYEPATIAGIPVRIFTPIDTPPPHTENVLINLHGGGFNSDSGSFTESIPIANLTHTRVVAVIYRLAPEHPFPAAIDDVITVYRDLLKTHQPTHIAIFGTSAGAILTAEVAVRLKQLNLPQPGALGIFSGFGDYSQHGDSQAMYTGSGLAGHLEPPSASPEGNEYAGTTDRHDPLLSPIFGDLRGLPPTLFITSTRDQLLSGTTILHRAYLRNGVDARLVVFEGLPHAFWNNVSLPESREAYTIMANFFTQQLVH
jgi:monoterpene epsilon-lactone hydrolase